MQGQQAQGKPMVREVHQGDAADQGERRARANAQRDLHKSLDRICIRGHAHHQLARVELVQVAIRKGLDFHEDGFTQIPRNLLTYVHRGDATAHGGRRVQDGDADHHEGSRDDHLQVLLIDTLVNDTLHQARDG